MLKLTSAILSVSLLFSFSNARINAAHTTEEGIVSGPEVRSRISDLYQEYGIDYEIVEENDVSFTESEVEKEIAKLEASLKQLVETKDNPTVFEVEVSDGEVGTTDEQDVISTYSHRLE